MQSMRLQQEILPNIQRIKINSTQTLPDDRRVQNSFQVMYYLIPKPDSTKKEKKNKNKNNILHDHKYNQFSRSVLSDSLQPHESARQASLSITNSRSSPRLMSIESVMPSSHLILCHPLLLLPPIPPSIRVFSNESTKYQQIKFSNI